MNTSRYPVAMKTAEIVESGVFAVGRGGESFAWVFAVRASRTAVSHRSLYITFI